MNTGCFNHCCSVDFKHAFYSRVSPLELTLHAVPTGFACCRKSENKCWVVVCFCMQARF